MFYHGHLIFSALNLFQKSWIVIGFGLACQSILQNWIWIWNFNHKFVMDLDWIDNPKNRI